MTHSLIPSSFRDPSGFLFTHEGILYRQVESCYRKDYEYAQQSELYQDLIQYGMLIPHQEIDLKTAAPNAYKILKPEQLAFVSYPYEWCFSQLKDAALLTLVIMRKALSKGMILKDASAYNIQFRASKPVFIDSLSFEIYKEGTPWIAYQQFCRHFLAPLALMSFTDIRLNTLFLGHHDGIPLDMTSRLLPFYTKLIPALALDIHLQGRMGLQPSNPASQKSFMKKADLINLLTHLEAAVSGMRTPTQRTTWKSYSVLESYTEQAAASKKEIVLEFLRKISFKTVWDLGAHEGFFSAMAAGKAEFVLSLDADPSAVEAHYQKIKKSETSNILPLVMDLTQPSPSVGWENKERLSLTQRGPADLIMMLAIIHHLAISNNLPLDRIASWISQLGRYALVEFVPKEDPKVLELLSRREDIFPGYTQAEFEKAFAGHFKIAAQKTCAGSRRTLYLFEKR